jgi:CheY-like chemotaxis protein
MSKRILVIDDYTTNLLIAKLTINQQGFFQIISYSEAQLALDFLLNNQQNKSALPDVLLLDLSMPVMSGWEFLDSFEELAPSLIKEIDIYILSSSSDLADIRRSRTYSSVNGFYTKPLTQEMLQQIMKNSLKTTG